MKRHKANDIVGIYKLIEFSHRKSNDYYWKVECQKCHLEKTLKISVKGMKNTKFCSNCIKGKYVNYSTPEEYIKAKSKIDEKGCWLWTGHISKRSGYCISKFRHIQQSAHRFSYKTFKGNIPKGLCICHICDVKHCVNPDHLFIGTHSDNIQDCIKKSRFNPPKGERSASTKLTNENIYEIRNLHNQGIKQKDLAKRFDISNGAISCIINNKTWKI
jgi:hypothetical protein